MISARMPTPTAALITPGLVGFVGNEIVACSRLKVGRQIGSDALVAAGLHARTDGFTSLAVLLGVSRPAPFRRPSAP
ncbi:Cation efflux family [Frankia torreyi]|uniref:Cation efflux family n=1 Tax=Frankia torreyi TaxID=1856 RepID=A0A0D8BHJ6_9ACTN|nr:Cation efflux family [Frankia torreyi]